MAIAVPSDQFISSWELQAVARIFLCLSESRVKGSHLQVHFKSALLTLGNSSGKEHHHVRHVAGFITKQPFIMA